MYSICQQLQFSYEDIFYYYIIVIHYLFTAASTYGRPLEENTLLNSFQWVITHLLNVKVLPNAVGIIRSKLL